jgi:hypothetical protein
VATFPMSREQRNGPSDTYWPDPAVETAPKWGGPQVHVGDEARCTVAPSSPPIHWESPFASARYARRHTGAPYRPCCPKAGLGGRRRRDPLPCLKEGP